MNDISQFPAGISVLEITYILASVLFILGLKMLSHPLTARRGNMLAAVGMVLAIVATILFHRKDGQPIGNIGWIIAAIVIGTVIGWVIAKRVKMTAMPQLVSFFNGMGGAAAALISMMEFPHVSPELIAKSGMANGHVLAILLGLVIGTVSWAGSMIAFGKLDGRIGDMRIKAMKYRQPGYSCGDYRVRCVYNDTRCSGLCRTDTLYNNTVWNCSCVWRSVCHAHRRC